MVTQEITSVSKEVEKRERYPQLLGLSIGAAIMERSMEGSQKTENRNTIQPSNSTFENLPEENKITNLKRYVYHSIIYNNLNMETT